MLTAREAFEKAIINLKAKIAQEHLDIIKSKIDKSIEDGKGECMLNADEILDKNSTKVSDKSKIIRSIGAYLQALGYTIEVGYGAGTLLIKWM